MKYKKAQYLGVSEELIKTVAIIGFILIALYVFIKVILGGVFK